MSEELIDVLRRQLAEQCRQLEEKNRIIAELDGIIKKKTIEKFRIIAELNDIINIKDYELYNNYVEIKKLIKK